VEALAIFKALTWHMNNFRLRPFIIYSDSLPVLKSLQNPKQNNSTLQRILLLYANFIGIYGGFSWVKAHVGISGNELADSKAKQAASRDFQGDSLDIPIPKSFIKRISQDFILREWQSQWDNSSTGRFTHKFIPRVSIFALFSNYYINVFLTDRGPFPAFLHRIGKLDSPNCVCGELGNVLHYTCDCTLTSRYHFPKPPSMGEHIWMDMILRYKVNSNKLCALIKWLFDNDI